VPALLVSAATEEPGRVCGNRAHENDNSAPQRCRTLGVKLFALLVRFTIRAGHDEAFDALVADTLAAITTEEPDTIVYASHTQAEEPSVRVFYECYRSHDAFQAHEAAPHTRRFLSERTQYLAHPPEVWTLAPVAGAINGRPLRGDGAPR
jgi:quinol monooxygenase YgiN